MSNSKLKILVSFLLLAFVFVVFPAKMTSADVVASGECGAQGNNLTWTFDNNGTLTISGSGKMINCTVTDGVISQPWLDYRKSIKTVVFEGEITSIGDYAFNGCENLTQITIPNGVDYLGEYSFAGCSSLESIEVPDGVKKIQTHAFALCHNLVSVTLHENLEEIGVSAFDDDQHIKELVIPSTVKKMYANTFHNTIGLECFTVCGPIEYKHAYSLKNFGAVKIVVLDSVTDLGVWNFSKDYNLRSLVINKETYDSASSKFPTKLTEDQIHFYYDVSYSNDGHGTVSGTTRTFGTDEVKLDITPERYYKLDQVIWTSGETTKTLTADENGNYIMPNVDAEASGATIRATFTEKTTADIVASGECGAQGNNLTWTLDEYGTLTISGSGAMMDWSSEELVSWYSNRDSIEKVVFNGEVTSIGKLAFTRCSALTSITIPGSVTSIGQSAFFGCENENFTSIVIPSRVTSIGDKAFFLCNHIENIEIPEGVTVIGISTFEKCTRLVSVKIPDGVTEIGQYAFASCTSLRSVDFPSSLKKIGNYAFYQNHNLQNITIKSSVSEFGSKVFSYDMVKKLVVLDSVTDLGKWSFTGLSDRPEVYINQEAYGDGSAFSSTLPSDKIHFYYEVSYSNDGHGTVIGTDRTFGTDEIELEFTPDSCYELDQVIWTSGETTKTLTADENGNYIMPNVDAGTPGATIKATFKVKSHHITTITGTPATCEEAGVETHYKCTACNKLFSDPDGQHEISIADTVIPALGHDLEEKAAKDPTCTEDGHEKYYECKRCHKKFSDAEGTKEISAPAVIHKLGHSLKLVKEKAPTKDTPGNIRHYKCEKCNKLFADAEGTQPLTEEQIVIPATGHNLTAIKAKDATCTATGNIAYYLCEDEDCKCGKAFSDPDGQHEIDIADTVIPALGHNIEEKTAKDPTCTEDGHEKYYECSRCHKKFSDAEGTNEISAPEKTDKLGHDWDEGEVTTKPECEAEGTRTFHCKRDGCTHTKTEPIPAKGHSKEPEHHEAVPPTHENEGSHEYYECPDCHKKFSDPGCEHEMTDAQIVDPPIGAAELGEAAEDKDGRKYVVTDPHIGGAGTVTFTGVETPVENLIIPDTVVIKLETYKVTKIASKAFYNDKTLKTVVIGSNIVSIDSYAFYGCSNLIKVSGGAKVKTIGASAFAKCPKLSSFTISSSVLSKIGKTAFSGDKKLKTLYIRKTTRLTKSGVKKSLKGSSVKTVRVKKSKVKKYKKYFKKSNSGRKVKVKK